MFLIFPILSYISGSGETRVFFVKGGGVRNSTDPARQSCPQFTVGSADSAQFIHNYKNCVQSDILRVVHDIVPVDGFNNRDTLWRPPPFWRTPLRFGQLGKSPWEAFKESRGSGENPPSIWGSRLIMGGGFSRGYPWSSRRLAAKTWG